MNKRIIFLITIGLISLFFMYCFRSSIYDGIMGFEYRPLLPKDFVDLRSNVAVVKQMFDPACHSLSDLETVSNLERSVSFYSFGLVKDLELRKREVILLEQSFLAQTKACKMTDSVLLKEFNNFILRGAHDSRNINLTNLNLKNELVMLENIGDATIMPRLVVNGKDWSHIEGILGSIIEDNMTNQQKVIVIWKFVNETRYHFAKSLSPSYKIDVLSFFNAWGYGNCGEATRAVMTLAQAAGFEAREVRLKGHIVAEVFYDNSWHMVDADAGVLFFDEEGNLLSVRDIKNNLSVLGQMNTSVYSPEYLKKAYSAKEVIFEHSFSEVNFSFVLRPGESVVFNRKNGDKFFSGENYSVPPEFSNGKFILKKKVKKDEITEFSYPYPIVGAIVIGDLNEVEFSTDGWVWEEVENKDLSSLFNNGYGVPNYTYYLRFGNEEEIEVVTIVQMAQRSLPLLRQNQSNMVEFFEDFGEKKAIVNVTFGFR